MPLKTNTLKDGSNQHWLQRIENWIAQMEQDGKKPKCSCCADKAEWEAADAYVLSHGLTGNGDVFAVLTCTCGCSILIRGSKIGLKSR